MSPHCGRATVGGRAGNRVSEKICPEEMIVGLGGRMDVPGVCLQLEWLCPGALSVPAGPGGDYCEDQDGHLRTAGPGLGQAQDGRDAPQQAVLPLALRLLHHCEPLSAAAKRRMLQYSRVPLSGLCTQYSVHANIALPEGATVLLFLLTCALSVPAPVNRSVACRCT